MHRKQLLITCFEPFGGRARNASQDAVMALPCAVGPYELRKLCLPVAFGEAGRLVAGAIGETAPSAVICVGEAGGRSSITPEMVAINLRFARIPDNFGAEPHDEPVLPGGENALFSTLPVRAMADAVRAAGIPAEVSYSAGTFVCNDTMYAVLDHLRGTGVPAGFIHVPADDALDVRLIARGLEAAIYALASCSASQ